MCEPFLVELFIGRRIFAPNWQGFTAASAFSNTVLAPKEANFSSEFKRSTVIKRISVAARNNFFLGYMYYTGEKLISICISFLSDEADSASSVMPWYCDIYGV